jgi:hypothetical protein
VAGSAHAQTGFELVVEVANGDAGHNRTPELIAMIAL